ncbi:DUF262 domain-containing protein [Rheinheimera sp.]|uniref:DUF262 domain-containing protein n=1 Tax=Rheinheimera sp. TaxID=1869214 RepID=UPI0027B98F6C|nr:DUF262 domain-containing protein [Rheinheimera sp.]
MRIEESRYSIAELIDMHKRKDLFVNEEYQRAPRLWPSSARSYFIDTILNDYPFPKIFFNEMIDRNSRRPRRELVDGQQRLLSIFDFVDDKFALGRNSKIYQGLYFSQLEEDLQTKFLSYTVSVDVIRGAQRAEILQMFRRMNAYTLPLNEAEKRHAEYFGEFKDWVNRQLDGFGEIFSNWGILSNRQIVRMADAELITEIALAITHGVVSSSPKKLKDLYEVKDASFDEADDFSTKLAEIFHEIQTSLSEIQSSFMTKHYVFLSLIVSMYHLKWGIPHLADKLGIEPKGLFFQDKTKAVANLLELAAAHEMKDLSKHKEYVAACSEGANREKQRLVRVAYISRALLDEI